jgi:phosphoglycerol transferase MdoB-like AlkP superfamily enzyme
MSELERIGATTKLSDVFLSFLMGIRFDIVITGYIVIIPFLILTIMTFAEESKIFKKVAFYYTLILLSAAFLVCAADIPFFNHFFSRFSVTAFEWMDSPMFVLNMIIEEPRYWLFILPYLVAVIVLYKFLHSIFYKSDKDIPKPKYWKSIPLTVLFLFAILIGIRGRLDEKSPIRVGTAYFSDNPFLNQLGLNPNFTLLRSVLDAMNEDNKPLELMDDNIALDNTQNFLQIINPDPDYPLKRYQNLDEADYNLHNVIIVIMESMSAAKMKRHGNRDNLTPFLDSISNEGYYFENAYTSGIHTFNGIFSTFFSFPAIFRQHPMKESSMYKYNGIASVLKGYNYSTIYFTTHDGQFDNVEGFLTANDFDKVISKKDYPSGSSKTTLGVPDDVMFEYSVPIIREIHNQKKPFFAAFMTASDHGPYFIPEYFKPKSKELKKQIVEYADYSIEKFIRLASKEPWFSNTIFVFVADHGAPINATYEISIDYVHTPLLFYAPEIIRNKQTFSSFVSQIDIFPTIMGLLKLPYVNNTLGIDALKNKRPFVFFNADDKYGVIDSNWFLIVRKDKSEALYRYKHNELTNYASENDSVVNKMKTYAESNLQTFQYILKKKKM